MLEVGKSYYIIAHACFHYIAEVVEVGPRWVRTGRCIAVHGCRRGWTEFFQQGIRDDTNYDVVPEGTILPLGLPIFPWEHEIPTERRQ